MPTILDLHQVLHLGCIDEDAFDVFQQQKETYFKQFHSRFWDVAGYESDRFNFRGDGWNEWITPVKAKGSDVRKLQSFLIESGFIPNSKADGIYGYVTLAGVRLFQEYVRSVEGSKNMGVPDGRVFQGTHQEMVRWAEHQLSCEWNSGIASPEYQQWLQLMPKVRDHYRTEIAGLMTPSDNIELFQLQELEKYPGKTDTRKLEEWTFDPDDVHLIGLRCNQEIGKTVRGNDDLFILLIKGMVFKFWGSTDPHPEKSNKYEPYLLEGQHKYRLSWHKRGDQRKVYKAMTPYDSGVLVFRDWSSNDALDENDIRKGLQYNPTGSGSMGNPNWTINIHWTFDGKTNWSAGCQVISGRSYVNHRGERIDCSSFSAHGYKGVSPISKGGVTHTQGAYTLLSDLILAYSAPGKDYVLYTLGRDGTIEQFATKEFLDQLAKESVLGTMTADAGGEALVQGLVDRLRDPNLA